jgi:hypothetical protein
MNHGVWGKLIVNSIETLNPRCIGLDLRQHSYISRADGERERREAPRTRKGLWKCMGVWLFVWAGT